jgi:hypothetical protein
LAAGRGGKTPYFLFLTGSVSELYGHWKQYGQRFIYIYIYNGAALNIFLLCIFVESCPILRIYGLILYCKDLLIFLIIELCVVVYNRNKFALRISIENLKYQTELKKN